MKVVSLRTPIYTAVVTVFMVVGLSALLTSRVQEALAAGRPGDVGGVLPSSAFLDVLTYTQVGIIVFGCWLMVVEQDRGNLRTSLLATPSRVRLFFAKVVIAAVGSLVIAAVTVFGTYVVRCFMVGTGSFTASGSEDVRVLAGYVGYWMLLGVFAFAVSAVVRNGIIGLSALLVVILVLPPFLRRLTSLVMFLPGQAGAQITHIGPVAATELGPVLGLIVVCVWVLVSLIGGVLSYRTWHVRQ